MPNVLLSDEFLTQTRGFLIPFSLLMQIRDVEGLLPIFMDIGNKINDEFSRVDSISNALNATIPEKIIVRP